MFVSELSKDTNTTQKNQDSLQSAYKTWLCQQVVNPGNAQVVFDTVCAAHMFILLSSSVEGDLYELLNMYKIIPISINDGYPNAFSPCLTSRDGQKLKTCYSQYKACKTAQILLPEYSTPNYKNWCLLELFGSYLWHWKLTLEIQSFRSEELNMDIVVFYDFTTKTDLDSPVFVDISF